MAAVGASGLSLVLGVYNTQQIASLKETIASVSGSGNGKQSMTASVLTTTVVPPPEVLRPAEVTIHQSPFQSASSSEIKEIQERLEQLESFSNSVSTSSTSNSASMSHSVAGLSTKLSELEMFANTSSTRSSTNEGNIVMINDEVDRLTTFATEELTAVRDRVAEAEESLSTNASNIGLLQTSIGDVETGVSDANSRIDAVVALSTAIENSLVTTQAAVTQNTGSITKNSTALTDLVLQVDKLGDGITLVDGNETETRNNLASLATSWNALNANAYVADGWLNAVKLRASNCKLALSAHDGQKSALHFTSLTQPDWCMYVSSPTGKATDGKKPAPHGDVTSSAVRMRVNGDPKCGFIVENDKNVGVFSVNTQGNTRMGLAKIANIDGEWAAFAHHRRHSVDNYAIAQHQTGRTRLNSSKGKGLEFLNDNKLVAFMKDGTFSVNNPDKTHRTTFNSNGINWIYCAHEKETYFGAGRDDHVAKVNKHGLFAKGLNVYDELVALKNRVATIEGKYLDRTRTVKIYNEASKLYLKRAGKNVAKVDGHPNDTQNHFSIHYD